MVVSHNFDCNLKDKEGRTCLHELSLNLDSNLEVIQLLIESKADATLRDSKGNTALDYFQNHENLKLDVIEYLISKEDYNQVFELASLIAEHNLALRHVSKFSLSSIIKIFPLLIIEIQSNLQKYHPLVHYFYELAKKNKTINYYLAAFQRSGLTNMFPNSFYQLESSYQYTLNELHKVETSINSYFVHPNFPEIEMNHAEVKKIFDSKTKPKLVALTNTKTDEKKLVILKIGDNTIQDLFIEKLFHLFNSIWRKNVHMFSCHLPFAQTYSIIPVSQNMNGIGYLEIIDESDTLVGQDWKNINEKYTLASAIGGYIAGFICGVRDRHKDNMLITKTNRIFFHIDFGYGSSFFFFF